MYDYENEELLERKENLEKLIQLKNERAQSIWQTAEAEKRDLTEEEAHQLDAILTEFEATFDKVRDIEAQIEAPKPRRKTDPDPLPRGPRSSLVSTALDACRGEHTPRVLDGRTSFAQMFADRSQDTGGWRNFQEYAAAIGLGLYDSRLRPAASGHREGEGSSGGFMVPTQFISELFDYALESEIVRPRAQVVPMVSSSISAPGFGYTDHQTSGDRSPIQWLAEAGEGTIRTANVIEKNLRAKKAAIFSKATSELLADAPNFERSLTMKFAQDLGFGLDYAFLWGNGVGQPLGVMNSPALITVAKETSQTAGTIHYDNVTSMLARLHPAGFNQATWLVGPDSLPQLFKIGPVITTPDGTGVGGGSAAGFQQMPDGTFRLLGRPVIVTEKMAALGTVGDILLADFSQYLIGLRRDASMERSIHAGWSTDEVHFRLIARVDGMPIPDQATTLQDGSRTVSPFVTLAAR